MRRAQNLPADKKATPEEQAERDFYHNNEDAEYAAGIRVGEEGFYDPQAGAEKHPIRRPESEPKPVLATDPGQPSIDKNATHVVSRERNEAVDKTEKPVVSSGRKATAPKE